MDNHKLVTISIFYFQNMRKMQSFNEYMLGKFLGFGRMHKNNIFLKERN